jgi:acylglycerol lipase
MVKARSDQKSPRTARAYRGMLGAFGLLTCYGLFLVSGCVHPVTQTALQAAAPVETAFHDRDGVMIAHDGAKLGLTVWPSQAASEPAHIVVGIHGMNDYAGEFRLAAPEWARRGVTVYAYDQRGFGRSPGRGLWPEEELLREDLRTATALARARHPDATLTVIGISMGAAVAMTAFASDRPPVADRFIASGPGLRGWGAVNPLYNASLWASARTRPGWIVEPPRWVTIRPTDNIDYQRLQAADPNYTMNNRIDQVYGVVTVMENGHRAAARLPAGLPVLISYGGRDAVIPENGPRRTALLLPAHVRTAYYPEGYHMLLSDLGRQSVIDDYYAFMLAPETPLPSGAPEWPFRKKR